MDRVFEANVASTAPAAVTATGFPTDGDPVGGILPTTPGAGWFAMITEEMRNVIEAAEMTPNGNDWTQLSLAIEKFANDAQSNAIEGITNDFGGANMAITASGRQLWPTGRIDVWMEVVCANAGNNLVTVTYPWAFPNSTNIPRVDCFDSTLTASTGQYFIKPTVIAYSTTGCTVAMGANGGSARTVTLCVDVRGH